MAFQADDRERLWLCLSLTRDQLKPHSVLARLMSEAERFDANYGTTVVTQIREALEEWEYATEALPAAQANDAYKSIAINNEVRLEAHGPGAASAALQNKRQGAITRILALLDANGWLQPYITTARVVPTL